MTDVQIYLIVLRQNREVKMKNIILCFLIVAPFLLFGQGVHPTIPGDPFMDVFFDDAEHAEWGFGGVVGAITRNGITYSQVRLRPEFNLGKFGIGLDLDFLFEPRGTLRKEDWDEWQDYIDKIFFIRYANRRDPFYFKVGCFPSYTLGNGLIFEHYTNMTRYPDVKNVGAQIGFTLPFSNLGAELFTHNVYKNEILAGRIHVNPLWATQIPFLNDIEIGLNIGADLDQFAKFPDSDGDGYPDIYDKFPKDKDYWLDTDGDGVPDEIDPDINGTGLIDHPSINPYVDATYPWITTDADSSAFNWHIVQDRATKITYKMPFYVGSIDYRIPLVENEGFELDHYGEIAMIKDYGNGIIFPGFGAKFLIFDAKLEMRNYSKEFIPGFFDRLYDEQRSRLIITKSTHQSLNIDYTDYDLLPKEALLKSTSSSLGWFGFLRTNIADFAYLKVAFQDMYSEQKTIGKSLWGSFTISPDALPKLKEAGLYYSQVHANYIDFINLRNESASFAARFIYGVSDNSDLICTYSETYQDVNKDGKIKGREEVISTFNMGVQFQF